MKHRECLIIFKNIYFYCFVMTILSSHILAYGQSFSILNSESALNDLSAQLESRTDLNGVKCGLIKVRCVLDDVTFKGNVIGEVEHRDGEYWVFLSNGSKNLKVFHPKLLPLDIDIEGLYGIAIKSSNTYILTLSIPEHLYVSSLVGSQTSQQLETANIQNQSNTVNTTLSGYVKDDKNGEELIGCSIIIKESNRGVASDINGFYELSNVPNNAVVSFQYIGYKSKEIRFTGEIPERFDVNLKPGKGTEKEEFFYDPNDQSTYFDLKGNVLSSRPSKKGTYIRVINGKPEQFKIK